jgi:hypothetical protein
MRQRRKSLASGVELLPEVWKNTIEIARELGLNPPSLS